MGGLLLAGVHELATFAASIFVICCPAVRFGSSFWRFGPLFALGLQAALSVGSEGYSLHCTEASPARSGMGRKNKGRSLHTPNWEERDDISPFKLAEKRLKRYKGKQTDFSGVLDFARHPTCELAKQHGAAQSSIVRPAAHHAPTPISAHGHQGNADGDIHGDANLISLGVESVAGEPAEGKGVRVMKVPGRDGLIILPGFLSEEEQLVLAYRCLAGKCLESKVSSAFRKYSDTAQYFFMFAAQNCKLDQVGCSSYGYVHGTCHMCRIPITTAPLQPHTAVRRHRPTMGDSPRSL